MHIDIQLLLALLAGGVGGWFLRRLREKWTAR
jgi:hypothetical protein